MTYHLTEEDFDALLTGTVSTKVRDHLKECPTCARAWRDEARAHAFLRQARPVPAPTTLHGRVMAALATSASPARPAVYARRWLLALLTLSGLAGSGLVAMGLIVLLGRQELTPLLGVATRVAHLGLRFLFDLLDVLLTVLEILALTPWSAVLVLTALLLSLLAYWTTRFYSRRLFA